MLTSKMQCSRLLALFLVLILYAEHVKANEESGYEVVLGKRFNLKSSVPLLKRCHWVFTKKNSTEKCCYHLKGKGQDCEHTKPNGKRCPKESEYLVTNDGKRSLTCNLTIECSSEFCAGQYKSYTADDELIQEMSVEKVIIEGGIGPGLITVTVLATLLLIAVLMVITLNRRGHIIQKDGKWSFQKEPHHLLKNADHQQTQETNNQCSEQI